MAASYRLTVSAGVAIAAVLFLSGVGLGKAAAAGVVFVACGLVAEAWVTEGSVFVRRAKLVATYGSAEVAERILAAELAAAGAALGGIEAAAAAARREWWRGPQVGACGGWGAALAEDG